MTEEPKKKKKISKLANFQVGLISSLLSQPFEVIKTSSITSMKGHDTGIKGMLKIMRTIFQKEGLRGFFRGGMTGIVKATINGGLFFTGIENFHLLTQGLRESHKVSPELLNFFNASITRFLITMTTNPIVVIKTRFEVAGSGQNTSLKEVVTTLLQKNGVKGLYKGILPTILRDVPFSGIQFSSYKFILDTGMAQLGQIGDSPPMWLVSISGGLSSIIAVLATYPMDNIRVRFQTDDSGHKKLTFMQAIRDIYQNEGLRGFYLGYMPRLFKKAIGTMISWVLYEYIKRGSSVLH